MATIVVLLLMVLAFMSVLYVGAYVWRRFWLGKRDANIAAVEMELMQIVNSDNVPIRPLLVISSVAGVAAVLSGFLVLHLLVAYAPRPKKSTPPVPEKSTGPALRVVVDDGQLGEMQKILNQCKVTDIVYIDKQKKIRCIDPNSKESARLFVGRKFMGKRIRRQGTYVKMPNQTRDSTAITPARFDGIQLQGMVPGISTTPTEMAKDVAERQGINRYSELIYFLLTFCGVMLRLIYDASRNRSKKSKAPLFSVNSLITSFVLAIATYALVIQTGMAGNAKVVTFQTCIFAVYNGLLSVSLLDLISLKPNAPAKC